MIIFAQCHCASNTNSSSSNIQSIQSQEIILHSNNWFYTQRNLSLFIVLIRWNVFLSRTIARLKTLRSTRKIVFRKSVRITASSRCLPAIFSSSLQIIVHPFAFERIVKRFCIVEDDLFASSTRPYHLRRPRWNYLRWLLFRHHLGPLRPPVCQLPSPASFFTPLNDRVNSGTKSSVTINAKDKERKRKERWMQFRRRRSRERK